MNFIYLTLLLAFTADSPNATTERSPQGETQTTHLLKVSSTCYAWHIEWIQVEQRGDRVQLQYRNEVNLYEDFFAAELSESMKAAWIQKILIGTPQTITDKRLFVQNMHAKNRLELAPNDWTEIISVAQFEKSKLIVDVNTVWVKLSDKELTISGGKDRFNFETLRKMLLAQLD
ncbi:MAG: hypothetical protein AAFN10_22870 [Bacteroidota bacterium]